MKFVDKLWIYQCRLWEYSFTRFGRSQLEVYNSPCVLRRTGLWKMLAENSWTVFHEIFRNKSGSKMVELGIWICKNKKLSGQCFDPKANSAAVHIWRPRSWRGRCMIGGVWIAINIFEKLIHAYLLWILLYVWMFESEERVLF